MSTFFVWTRNGLDFNKRDNDFCVKEDVTPYLQIIDNAKTLVMAASNRIMQEMTLKEHLRELLLYGCGTSKIEYLFVVYIRPNITLWKEVAELSADGMTVVFVKASRSNKEHLNKIAIFSDWDEMLEPYFVKVRLSKNNEFVYSVIDSVGCVFNKPNGNTFEELVDCLLSNLTDIAIVSEGIR